MIDLVNHFEEHDVKLISHQENFNTTTPQGILIATVFQDLSQFERDLIVEHTREGLKSARSKGRKDGHPKVEHKHISRVNNLYYTKAYSVKAIVEMTGISRYKLYRYLKKD